MIIREKVARAICESEHGAPEPDAEIYVRMKRAKAWEGRIDMATAAINAFLAAAAEPDEETGISWHMRPDVATETMLSDHQIALLSYASVGRVVYLREAYRAMLTTAPKFEWDK